jgi:uncharacterized protein (DUF2249 family)
MQEFVIEAQKIPAQDRHPFIFQSFDNLQGGDSLIIINTHDPIPLLRQLQEDRPEQFSHEYLLQGPKEWRVRISKIKKEGCCGFCGS